MISLICVLPLVIAHRYGAIQDKDPAREVQAWVSQDVSPSSKIRINVNTRNVRVVDARMFPIDALRWLTHPNDHAKKPAATGKPVRQFQLTIGTKEQIHGTDNYFARQVNLPPIGPGVYLVTISGQGKEAWGVVDVTNMNVLIRRSPYKLLAWVTEFKTGQVLPGVQVDVYRPNTDRPVSHTATGADGASQIPLRPGEDIVVVRKGADIAGIGVGEQDPDGQLRCLFETDRPIYRPGQTIEFKAILRRTKGQVYANQVNAKVTAVLRDPRDNPLDQKTLTSNEMGSVAGSFKIPQEGMLGAYSVVLTVGDDSAYQTFTVAEYRKPEFKIDVKPAPGRHFAKDDLHFSVDASYYFGAPVTQAAVHWTLSDNPSPYAWSSPESRWFYGGDGNLYPRDTFAAAAGSGEGDVVTDNKGHADIVIHTADLAFDSNYAISVTVTDSSRRQITGGASAIVYTSELRIGLNCLKQAVAIGDLIPVDVRVVDLDGKPRSARVTLSAVAQVWDDKKEEFKEEKRTKAVDVPSSGRLVVNLPAFAYGNLRIDAETKDGHGRKAFAEASVDAESIDYKPPKNNRPDQPSISVVLDKRSYVPGERVQAFVKTNRPKLPILMILTGGDIWDYKVIMPGKRLTTWTVPTSTLESPNAYVSYCQWAERGRMQGNVIVPLPDRSKLLQVDVQSAKQEYKPGEQATFIVTTRNDRGQPVSAEVALAVVDEAIYALSEDNTPDPYGFYWGMRGDTVSDFASGPEELSGGAFQMSNSVAPVRQRFEDTAYWNAFVNTDASGTGSARFEMPGNLTAWRATVRAVTGETRVGAARTTITATRPITLRLATPRQAASGDRFSLIGTVNNRTKKAMSVDVYLRASGVTVGRDARQTVRVPANGMATAVWSIEVRQVPVDGKMTLTARAQATGSNDSDLGDALQVSVPIVPKGLAESHLIGGTMGKQAATTLTLPPDTLHSGAVLTVRISGGVSSLMHGTAGGLLNAGRYGTMSAVNTLKAACAISEPDGVDAILESFALLSKDQGPAGWGWWENSPPDAKITAEVGYALAESKVHGYRVFKTVSDGAIGACEGLYNQTNLWEDRARLAASLVMLNAKDADNQAQEVQERGIKISPFGKLRLAEALVKKHPEQARKLLDQVLPLVSDGPAEAYVPVGFGIGWSASEKQTTSELLIVLRLLDRQPDLQAKLVRHLVLPVVGSYDNEDSLADMVTALSAYVRAHQTARSIGDAKITVNGQSYPLTHSTVEESATAVIRDVLLHGGSNSIEVARSGDGETLYTVTAMIYRPLFNESTTGVRVVRRYETLNDADVWTEVAGPIKPNEPVRCTVTVWGDDISDALKIVEPIPAGFEFVDSEYTADSREEVRDGALIHYMLNGGTPRYFRYYLRAEADGVLAALPATAEYLRRPATKGHSSLYEITVKP